MKVSELIILLSQQDQDKEVSMLTEGFYSDIKGIIVEDGVVRIHEGDVA